MDRGGEPLFKMSVIPLPTRFLMRKNALPESSDSSPLASSGGLVSFSGMGDCLPSPPDKSASICLSRSLLKVDGEGRACWFVSF